VRSALTTIGQRVERWLLPGFPESLRSNIRTEAFASIVFGIFYAAIVGFLPVVLRRLGASTDLLALYLAQTYLGTILTPLSIRVMRGQSPKRFLIIFWLLARGSLILTAIVNQAEWLLLLTALFWMFELFPSPAYARILQVIYPNPYRGRSLSVVRTSMLVSMLLMTPIVGWALDAYGHRVVLPVAAIFGIMSALIFGGLQVDEKNLPPLSAQAGRGIWSILKTDPRFTLYILSLTLYGLGLLVGAPFFAIIQVDRLQLSYTTIGMLNLVQSITWLISTPVWGRWLDRRGGLWVIQINLGIAVILPLSYVWATNAWMLLPAFIVSGIISAGIEMGVLTTGIDLAKKDRVAEYSALQSVIIGIRGMVGPFLGSALVYAGLSLPTIFGIGAILMILGWLSLFALPLLARTNIHDSSELPPRHVSNELDHPTGVGEGSALVPPEGQAGTDDVETPRKK